MVTHRDLVVIGAGGHSRVVADAVESSDHFVVKLFIDPLKANLNNGSEISASVQGMEPGSFIVAIGNNEIRQKRFLQLLKEGWTPETVIHRSAIISGKAKIGQGTFVGPGAIINSDAVIEENCIINSGAIVEHHCHIGAHTHIAPGAVLGGAARVGSGVLIGLGATILPEVSTGDGVILGAGSVLTQKLEDNRVAFGNPAKEKTVKAQA